MKVCIIGSANFCWFCIDVLDEFSETLTKATSQSDRFIYISVRISYVLSTFVLTPTHNVKFRITLITGFLEKKIQGIFIAAGYECLKKVISAVGEWHSH